MARQMPNTSAVKPRECSILWLCRVTSVCLRRRASARNSGGFSVFLQTSVPPAFDLYLSQRRPECRCARRAAAWPGAALSRRRWPFQPLLQRRSRQYVLPQRPLAGRWCRFPARPSRYPRGWRAGLHPAGRRCSRYRHGPAWLCALGFAADKARVITMPSSGRGASCWLVSSANASTSGSARPKRSLVRMTLRTSNHCA